jgi:hypothetical protein
MKFERGVTRMKKPYEFLENLNLPQPMYRLTLRPTVVLIAMASLGVIVLIAGFWNFKLNWLLIFFGLYFIGMVVFSVVMVKDRIVADLYDDQVVLYDKQDQRYGVIIPLSEVESWKYQTGVATGDTLTITLENGEVFAVESFKSRKIVRHFYKRLPEKEQRRKIFDVLNKKK